MQNYPDKFPPIRRLWGLLEYKPHWTLSVKGWIIVGLIWLIAMIIFSQTIHPFLAIRKPIKAEVLVIEGWVGDIVIKGAIEEIKNSNYQWIITTGSVLNHGSFLSQYKNFAEVTAATLEVLGISKEKIIPIPTPTVKIDRTAASAMAIKDWIKKKNLDIKGINIYSYDVHTRRSWYIFKEVFQPEIKVGAIAYLGAYDSQKWWTSSAGFRSVTSEVIAYFYARFFWKA